MFIHVSQLFKYLSGTHFCVTLREHIIVQSCGKFRYYVCPPTNPKFHELRSFGHILELQAPYILFHQSKHRSVNHFFHDLECFSIFFFHGIYVPTNV